MCWIVVIDGCSEANGFVFDERHSVGVYMDVEVTVSRKIKDREEVGAKFGYMEDFSELYWISVPPCHPRMKYH